MSASDDKLYCSVEITKKFALSLLLLLS